MERDILAERRGFLLSSVTVGAALVIPATTFAEDFMRKEAHHIYDLSKFTPP